MPDNLKVVLLVQQHVMYIYPEHLLYILLFWNEWLQNPVFCFFLHLCSYINVYLAERQEKLNNL